MPKFFNFINKAESESADLFITGDIVIDDYEETYNYFGLPCASPKGFKEQLNACGDKPLNVYINSYGGHIEAASSIYSMLREYKGKVTVKIDSIAASAATLIAMGGDKVLMARTAYMIIHEPLAYVDYQNRFGFQKCIDLLNETREGAIDVYARKSKLSREEISNLISAKDGDGTILNFSKALEYGFVDGEIGEEKPLITDEILNAMRDNHLRIFNSIKPQNKPILPVEDNEEQTDSGRDNMSTEAQIKAAEARYRAAMLK